MPDRREFMSAMTAAALVHDQRDAPPPSDPSMPMIPRESNPPNRETHPYDLRHNLTPTDVFYVRNHFPTPKIDAKTWRLKVEGAVEKPLSLSIDEVLKLPAASRQLTMECAGNGRVYLVPKVRGVNWAVGAVGNAEWKGVTLATLLERAGVKKSAVEVVLEGADVGSVNDDPKSPGPIAYARSLPIAKARQPEVLLAYQMNGQTLSADHGWPLRAIVGGWYGMASVKWLTRIIVAETPFQGYWQTMDYSQFDRTNGLPTLAPITGMRVKAIITAPIDRKTSNQIRGVAWAGENAVAKVEVSTDGGKSWQNTVLSTKPHPFVWTHWVCLDAVYGAPPYRLMARATDSAGNIQPMDRDPDRRTYQVNHVIPIDLES